MSINISELIWTVICFLVLLFVLKKLLYDPIIRVMDARNAEVEGGLEAGRRAKQARDENDEALLQARKDTAQQASAIVQEAKAADDRARAEAIHAAKQANAQSMKDTRDALREEEAAVTAQLDAEIPELTELLAGSLLGKKG